MACRERPGWLMMWDGAGPLPMGERWARYPRGVDVDGIGLGGSSQELISTLDADHRVALQVSADVLAVRDLRRCGEAVCLVAMSQDRFELTAERGGESTTTALIPPTPGNSTLFFLQLSPADGAILQQAAFDLGPLDPAGETDPTGMAQALDEEHFLVGRAGYDQPVQTLEVHGWSGGTPQRLSLGVPDGCTARLSSQWRVVAQAARQSLSSVILATDCSEGPHGVRVEGEGFDYDTPRASTVFDVSVE